MMIPLSPRPRFVSVDLAARIERVEANLTASIGRALADRPGTFVFEVAGGVAVYTGPSSPMNKLIGMGFNGPPADEILTVIEEAFRIRGARLQAELSTMADPSWGAKLSERGYVLQGFENVLGRPIDGSEGSLGSDSATEVMPMRAEDHPTWLDVAVTGFQHADSQGVQPEPLPPREALEEALREFTLIPGFLRYFAYLDGQIAGVATLRLDDRLAQLCGAATLPAFRRRGVQSALLKHRLAHAAAAGCELALMTTQPGSKSQENGYRQGFALLYSRALMVKDPDARSEPNQRTAV